MNIVARQIVQMLKYQKLGKVGYMSPEATNRWPPKIKTMMTAADYAL